MEELNRNQFILLVLLVSFVTSLATGIVTVTLMDQSSPGVSQTINRVVERTIERVVPEEPKIKEVIKEVEVPVMKEEDMIARAYKTAKGNVFPVVKMEDGSLSQTGSATLLNQDGLLVSFSGVIVRETENEEGKDESDETESSEEDAEEDTESESTEKKEPRYMIVPEEGFSFPVEITKKSGTDDELLWLEVEPGSREDFLSYVSGQDILEIAVDPVAVGQTVITVGAIHKDNSMASVGVISQIRGDGHIFKTKASEARNMGGPVLNTEGLLIGLSLGSEEVLTGDTLFSIVD